MSDRPNADQDGQSQPDAVVAFGDPVDGVSDIVPPAIGTEDTIPVVEERLSIATRRRSTGSVRVGTRTEVVDAVAEVELDRYRVEVTRVAVGRVVEEVPAARAEGDTTIIPVVEERLVVVKQLFLVEEVHVRHVLEREQVIEPVSLRRQNVVIQRVDPRGEPTGGDHPLGPPRADL